MDFSMTINQTLHVVTHMYRPHKTIPSFEVIDPFPNTSAPARFALASSACVDKTTKIVTEFTRKDPFLYLKQAK